jgi:hypothetical protein
MHPARPVICVIGMHRSGTSCLAGSLEQFGVFFGEVQQANRFNRKGNREREDINRLNELVLAESGGSWREPPSILRWTEEHARMRDAIIEDYRNAAKGPWGIKDPRLTFTLPFWRRALNEPVLVGTYRHPLTVAASLATRNGFGLAKSLEIWRAYNSRLIALHEQFRLPIVCFDVADAEYRDALTAAALRLGTRPDDRPDEFFDPALRHHVRAAGRYAEEDLPADIADVYERLNSIYLGQRRTAHRVDQSPRPG